MFHHDARCEYGFVNGAPVTFVDYASGALESHAADHHMLGNALLDGDRYGRRDGVWKFTGHSEHVGFIRT